MLSIETFFPSKLISDRLRSEHLDLLCIMHQDSTIMATLAGVRSDEQTQKILKENLNHWERYGYRLWIFR
ncbi:MAG: hypothetical protein V7L01_17980 [Nostoc sp.]|uniref:hypothetical protein n=1 Tax=Nostoc sp. TaxID=1180 RepID=UPI002FFC5419